MKGVLLVLSLLLISAAVSAEVYKWVDDKGEVHYGDRPKGDQDAPISIDTSSASKADAQESEKAKTQKLIDAMDKSRKEQAKLNKKKLADQRKQDDKCLKERDKLHKLEAKMQKNYSEFSNDRPASYQHLEAEAADRKKYLQQYCN
jgi:hypothetical protein